MKKQLVHISPHKTGIVLGVLFGFLGLIYVPIILLTAVARTMSKCIDNARARGLGPRAVKQFTKNPAVFCSGFFWFVRIRIQINAWRIELRVVHREDRISFVPSF